jgi:hypothetical protein
MVKETKPARAYVALQRKRIKTPSQDLQVFATVVMALEELWSESSRERVWRQVGWWKGFKSS